MRERVSRPAIWSKLKGATSLFADLEKLSLNFSGSSSVIRVIFSILHHLSSLMVHYDIFGSFSMLVKYYFQIFLHLKVMLYMAKTTHKIPPQTSRFKFELNQPCLTS